VTRRGEQGMHTACLSVSSGHAHLQQARQERDVVGPFLLGRVPEGERALDARRISPEVLVFFVEGCGAANQFMGVFLASSAGPYSPRRRCEQLVGPDSSGQTLAGRRAAG
jgi:hypothetical protein